MIRLNKNLILVKKQMFDEQLIDGIIMPSRYTGSISYGTVVYYGGIQNSKYSEIHNINFVEGIEQGSRICYYNHNETELTLENDDNKYHLISVSDIIYIIV